MALFRMKRPVFLDDEVWVVSGWGTTTSAPRTTTFWENPWELVPSAQSTWPAARKRRIPRPHLGDGWLSGDALFSVG